MQAIGRAPETLETEPALPPALPTDVDDSIYARFEAESRDRLGARKRGCGGLFRRRCHRRDAADFVRTGTIWLFAGLTDHADWRRQRSAATRSHALTVTGQLNIPIYQAGVEEAAVRQAKELHSQAQLNVAGRPIVRCAKRWPPPGRSSKSAEASIASNEAAERANEIAFEGVTKEQQVGGRTILDVLNAEQELLNASVALVSAKRNAEVAAFQVLAANGSLTAKNLGLKVKLYDPLEHYDDDAARWIGLGD